MSKVISQLADLETLAEEVIEHTPSEREKAYTLALSGELGAGKTTFVRVLAEKLGIEEPVRSPTYLLIKSFTLPTPRKNIKQLVHIDAYRVENSDEFETLNLPELLKNPTNLIVIEWAEKVDNLLPDDVVYMRFEVTGEKERTITMQ